MQGTACFHCTPSDPPSCHEPRAVFMSPVSRYSASKKYIVPCTAISLYFFGIYMHWKCGVVWLFGQSPHRVLLLEHPLHAHQLVSAWSRFKALSDMKAFVNTLLTLHQCTFLQGLIPRFSSFCRVAFCINPHSGVYLHGPRLRNEIAQ